MNDHQQVMAGRKAKELLDEPIIKDFFTTIRNTIFTEWRNSVSGDSVGREKCHQLMKVVDELERHFRKYVESGVLASAQIAAAEKIKEQKHYGA